MDAPDTLIAVFRSTHETLRAEKALKEKKMPVRAVTKPRTISSNCQLALRFPVEKKEEIDRIIAKGKFDFVGFFIRDEQGGWSEAP